MEQRDVLISGASVAGPALAFWLARHGFRPVIVERSGQLRGGGYAAGCTWESWTGWTC
jgi:2-polyprenyl-6-methoxyphenol hydroxylase-like FAD-dependent oxidoreductase